MLSLLAKLLGLSNAQIPPGSEWEIAWRSLPDLWVIFLVLLPGALLYTAWVYRRESRSIGRNAKLLLGGLRAFVLLLLLLILFEPVLRVETSTTNETTVVFLIDSSLSMSIKDRLTQEEARRKAAWIAGIVDAPEPRPLAAMEEQELDRLARIDLVNRALTNPRLGVIEEIKKRHRVQVFGFAGGLVSDPPVGEIKADGAESGIGEAIVGALKKLQSQIVVGIVLLTDGRNTKGVTPDDVAATLNHDHPVPVYVVAVGNPAEPRDIEVKALEGPDVALAKDFVMFKFKAVSLGYEGKTVEVVLQQGDGTEDDPVVERKSITLEGGGREQEVEIQFKPEEKGNFVCTLSIPPQEEELIVENNSAKHDLQVVDDKIKILYVDGYPRWEYRYLKNALVRDHSVEVWVLLQSADIGFPQECSKQVQPLSDFPAELKELNKSDVILLGDVDPNGPYFAQLTDPEKTLQNIVQFVENFGGGLAVIAGTHDSPRSYRNTPLARILPIVPSEDFEDLPPRTERIQLKLTPAGREHPITKLEMDDEENAELWEDKDQQNNGLPGIFWYTPVKKVKPGATVLVARSSPMESQQAPMIVSQQVGKGRTLFVATDETWRWRFVRGDKYFYAFWREAIGWLRGGRLLGSKRFEIHTEPAEVGPNDPVEIEATIYDTEYQPSTDPTYPCRIELPGVESKEIELTLDPKKTGRYHGAYKPSDLGTYTLSVGPGGLEGEKERATAQFKVVFPNREFENPSLDLKTLEAVADKTSGTFLPIYDLDQLPKKIIQKASEVAGTVLTREFDLWDSPLVYLLFTVLITAEWALRKRFNLL